MSIRVAYTLSCAHVQVLTRSRSSRSVVARKALTIVRPTSTVAQYLSECKLSEQSTSLMVLAFERLRLSIPRKFSHGLKERQVNSQTVTLIAAVIALLGSILSLFVSTRLALRKERRQLLWSKELDRFFALEELAGELVEVIGSYRAVKDQDAPASFVEKYKGLEMAAGRFGRYPDVREAIRVLHNTVGRLYAAKKDSDDDERAIRDELRLAFPRLLSACDAVVGRQHTRIP